VPIPPPRPGPATVVSSATGPTQSIALTIDDGYCEECVGGYVAFVERSGIPITFSPNAIYQKVWTPYADRLRPLIEAGQVQIGNHTYHHDSLVKASDATIRSELERNDEWIQHTFGITSRPWLRPPFGYRNAHTDSVAAGLGYTKIVMWNGSFGDSGLLAADVLLGEADKWLRAGTIMLGHANAPTVLGLFDQIRAIMAERRLQPVTLDTMFGTSRATG
jgi:peptidoglycan/xylan/chitin deacetylase (PgdA/CDA1 family)